MVRKAQVQQGSVSELQNWKSQRSCLKPLFMVRCRQREISLCGNVALWPVLSHMSWRLGQNSLCLWCVCNNRGRAAVWFAEEPWVPVELWHILMHTARRPQTHSFMTESTPQPEQLSSSGIPIVMKFRYPEWKLTSKPFLWDGKDRCLRGFGSVIHGA